VQPSSNRQRLVLIARCGLQTGAVEVRRRVAFIKWLIRVQECVSCNPRLGGIGAFAAS